MLKKTIAAAFLLQLMSSSWGQTYWLARFAPSDPKSPPAQLRVEPPTHTEVDVTFITIDGDLLIVNDHICHARLSPNEPATLVKFDKWKEVEEIGSYKKFRANIISHLKSDPDTWTKSMWMKEIKSAVPSYAGECGLFSGTRRIYFGNNDVIIPDPFHGYYRYIKGAPAKFYTTMEESEQKKIRGAERTKKLEERLLKESAPVKPK